MVKVKAQSNLLEGPLFPKILRFSIPLILTTLLQTLYSSIDLMVIGMSDASGAVGAIGTATPMNSLFLNFCIGFSIGTNVVVARNIGARERGKTQRAVHSSVCVGLVFGIVVGILGQLLCEWILRIMGAEGMILTLALRYCRIYFMGMPFMALTNVLAAVLRAKGDTRTPLIVLAASGLLKTVTNALLILVFHWDVDGAALTTCVANLFSTVVLFVILCRDAGWCRICLRKLRFDWESAKETLMVGIPAGINSAAFQISNMQIQSAIMHVNNTLYPGGSAVVDGHAASYSVECMVYAAANSISQTAITFTSQHLGAGKLKRIGAVMRNCVLFAVVISGVLGFVVCLLSDPIMSLFVRDRGALDAAATRNWIMMSTYALVGLMEAGTGVLRGLGKTLTSTIITMVGVCVLRVVWIWVLFPLFPTLECIYLSYPASWLTTAVVNLLVIRNYRRKLEAARESA